MAAVDGGSSEKGDNGDTPFAKVTEKSKHFDPEALKSLFAEALNIDDYMTNKAHHTYLQFQNDAEAIAED